MNPFDYVKAINRGQDIIRDSDDPDLMEKGFESHSFLIHRTFSYFHDTIWFANQMNQYYDIPAKLKNDFYLNTIRPKSRFTEWAKKDTQKNFKIVQEYYGYNNKKTLEALSILTDAELEVIAYKDDKGGRQ